MADTLPATSIRILHNVATDDAGRLTGLLDGYRHGDTLVEVFAYMTDTKGEAIALADEAFHLFNIGDDAHFGRPDNRALIYRREGNRSLSVGDVVIVGDEAFACAPSGWRHLNEAFLNVAKGN